MSRHYDVIIGIFQGPVTLPFLKVEAQNLVGWGILRCSRKGQCFISITSFTDTLYLKLSLTLMTSENEVRMPSLEGTQSK